MKDGSASVGDSLIRRAAPPARVLARPPTRSAIPVAANALESSSTATGISPVPTTAAQPDHPDRAVTQMPVATVPGAACSAAPARGSGRGWPGLESRLRWRAPGRRRCLERGLGCRWPGLEARLRWGAPGLQRCLERGLRRGWPGLESRLRRGAPRLLRCRERGLRCGWPGLESRLRWGTPGLLRWPEPARLTRSRLKPRFAARHRIGMEVAATRPVRLKVARDPVRGMMPAAFAVIVSPLAAEQHQWHGHAAIEIGRLTIVVAVARIDVGGGLVRRGPVTASCVARRVIFSRGIAIALVRRRNVATAQWQEQSHHPEFATHRPIPLQYSCRRDGRYHFG
jgi:hypothetical protein